MNEERRQAYQNLIDSLLTCPSEERIEILQANLELIDDGLAQYLREWATEIMPTLDAEEAYNRANILYGLNISFKNLRQGSRASNLEVAIACLEIGLTVVTREAYSEDWAMFQNSLGSAYYYRIRGEKAENLELAIAAFQASLEVYTRAAFPEDWATCQNNLGMAYLYRIRGEKAENLELAIAAFQASLEIYTRDAFPEEWARSQNNLGMAYLYRIRGEKAENLELAIAAYEAALSVYTRNNYPEKWATTQNSLAAAYSQRIRGEKADNIESSIAFYAEALSISINQEFPQDWARTLNSLATFYSERSRGEKAKNIEKAIEFYQSALSVLTREAYPQDWARSQNNLGNAYSNRIRGEKSDNIEMAIEFYQSALSVLTRNDYPEDWATTQNNLGNAYSNRIRGEKSDNIEMAIEFYQSALSVLTRNDYPEDWATTQNNLATAYSDRIRGERADSIEMAIECFQAALEVRSLEAFPEDWATTKNNLANAYSHRIRGEKSDNIEMAIAFYQASLSVYTRDAFPEQWAIVQKNLGNIYGHRIYGSSTENITTSINLYQNYVETKFIQGVKSQRNRESKKAYSQFADTIEVLEICRNKISSEKEKQKFAEEWNKVYQSMVEVCLDMENSTAALEYVERSKTRNLVELFHKARSLPSQVQRISFAEIRSLLAENEAILEWYITYNGFKVFIITRDSPQPDIWQSSYQDLQALQELQQEYLDDIKHEEKYDNWKNQLDSRLEKLAEILHIDEIISRLPENCQKLILVPFRYLHLFPLHALASSRQKADKTVETGCLLELFPGGVRYTPSCQLLQLSQRENLTAEDTSPSKFFAIQNPTEDLDFTDIEVEAIAKSFNPAEILSRQNASKAGLQQQIASLQNADIAHFSCHGFFDFDNPEKSALILAGAKVTPLNPPLVRGETGEDFPLVSEETEGKETPPLSKGGLGGVPSDEKRYIRSRRGENYDIAECLTLEEIFDLQLSKCRLVALSACETGLTDARKTTDEYIGLTSGFFYAGATSVLSTLWAVNDVSTAILTIKFYELFRGETQPAVAVALRESQLWLRSVTVKGLLEWVKASQLLSREHKQKIQDRYSRGYKQDYQPYESPVYWAAFCAVGQ